MKKLDHQKNHKTTNFDKALYLSMFTSYFGIFLAMYVQEVLAKTKLGIWIILLLSFLVTMGTIVLAVWAGAVKLVVALFRRKSDSFWMVLIMPLLAFVVSFVAMMVLFAVLQRVPWPA